MEGRSVSQMFIVSVIVALCRVLDASRLTSPRLRRGREPRFASKVGSAQRPPMPVPANEPGMFHEMRGG
jgi:hypothetical protein